MSRHPGTKGPEIINNIQKNKYMRTKDHTYIRIISGVQNSI